MGFLVGLGYDIDKMAGMGITEYGYTDVGAHKVPWNKPEDFDLIKRYLPLFNE